MLDIPKLLRYVGFSGNVNIKEPWQKPWKLSEYVPKECYLDQHAQLNKVTDNIERSLPDKPEGYFWKIESKGYYDANLQGYCYTAYARCIPDYLLGY